MRAPRIKLLISDVDGTLVTSDKLLTDRSVEAVDQLHRAGVLFAVTSGRPPRGMSMLIDPLSITTPLSGFNGGLVVDAQMEVLEQRTIPEELVAPIVALLESFRLSVWIYQGCDWLVLDRDGPHVRHEAWTCGFDPTVVASFDAITGDVAKIVGVSDDHEHVQDASAAAKEQFGKEVSAARSQLYYLDVTHPQANKGSVVRYLARTYDVAEDEIATIGDMPNDVLMFARSGLSIAMGNADVQVHRAARHVTTSNDDEGFANAVERYILAL
jgi:Cof subfamily protein (haloacid dehalogenase superfamily)